MLLVTLGYDANKAGLVGAGWAAKTNALADENGLLEDVNTSFTGPVSYTHLDVYKRQGYLRFLFRDRSWQHHLQVRGREHR